MKKKEAGIENWAGGRGGEGGWKGGERGKREKKKEIRLVKKKFIFILISIFISLRFSSVSFSVI